MCSFVHSLRIGSWEIHLSKGCSWTLVLEMMGSFVVESWMGFLGWCFGEFYLNGDWWWACLVYCRFVAHFDTLADLACVLGHENTPNDMRMIRALQRSLQIRCAASMELLLGCNACGSPWSRLHNFRPILVRRWRSGEDLEWGMKLIWSCMYREPESHPW